MYMKRYSLVDANGGETGLSIFDRRAGGRSAVVGDEGGLPFAFVADMVVQERKVPTSLCDVNIEQAYLAHACTCCDLKRLAYDTHREA